MSVSQFQQLKEQQGSIKDKPNQILLSRFRRQTLKKHPLSIRQRFQSQKHLDLAKYNVLKIQCGITLSGLSLPIRSRKCQQNDCVFNLEDFIETNWVKICKSVGDQNEDVTLDVICCPTCKSNNGWKDYYVDRELQFYTQILWRDYEQIFFDPEYANLCVNQNFEFFIHLLEEGKYLKLGGEDAGIQKNQKKNATEQKVTNQLNCIQTPLIQNLREESIRHQKMGIESELDVEQICQRVEELVEENIQLQYTEEKGFYENGFIFTVSTVNNLAECVCFLFFPALNKTWQIILRKPDGGYFSLKNYSQISKFWNQKCYNLIISGGSDSTKFYSETFVFELFQENPNEINKHEKDPKSNLTIIKGKQIQDSLIERGDGCALSYKGKVVFLSGNRFESKEKGHPYCCTQKVDYYDSLQEKWLLAEDMPEKRYQFSTAIQNQFAYLVGGQVFEKENFSKQFVLAKNILQLNLNNFTWQKISVGNPEKPHYFRWKGIAFFSQQDKIFIFGGKNSETENNLDLQNSKYQYSQIYQEFEKNQATEICLSTGICTFTNLNYMYTVEKKLETQNHHFDPKQITYFFDKKPLEIETKTFQDLQPVQFNDRIYIAQYYTAEKDNPALGVANNQPFIRIIVYDEIQNKKISSNLNQDFIHYPKKLIMSNLI